MGWGVTLQKNCRNTSWRVSVGPGGAKFCFLALLYELHFLVCSFSSSLCILGKPHFGWCTLHLGIWGEGGGGGAIAIWAMPKCRLHHPKWGFPKSKVFALPNTYFTTAWPGHICFSVMGDSVYPGLQGAGESICWIDVNFRILSFRPTNIWDVSMHRPEIQFANGMVCDKIIYLSCKSCNNEGWQSSWKSIQQGAI